MAIEYIYDAVKATAGENITITAKIKEEDGTVITENCSLILYNDDEILVYVVGEYTDDVWNFTIPAQITEGLKGRFWYSVQNADVSLCFDKPIYLV